MSASVTSLEDLAGVKRHAMWVAGYFAPVRQLRVDGPSFLAERDIARAKRGIGLSSAQHLRSR